MAEIKFYTEKFWNLCRDYVRERPFKTGAVINGEFIAGKIGLHGTASEPLGALILVLQNYPLGTLLDLGSGAGGAVIYGAHHGWNAYGIEFCNNAYRVSIDNLKKAKEAGYIKQELAKIAYGNFFPADFQVLRHDANKEDMARETLEEHLNRCEAGNPYDELAISLHQIDLFFHYQVERRDNILRLISERAKPGSRLLFRATMGDSFEVPKNLAEIVSDFPLHLYEKIN